MKVSKKGDFSFSVFNPKSRDDTLKHKNDSDILQPCARYILEKAQGIQEKEDRVWTFLDFVDKYAAGTIRNNLVTLRRKELIKRECRDFLAYYKLTGNKPKKKMTFYHIRGGVGVRGLVVDFVGFVESLPWDVTRAEACLWISTICMPLPRVDFEPPTSGDINHTILLFLLVLLILLALQNIVSLYFGE